MGTEVTLSLTESDKQLLGEGLMLLESAGVHLADEVEHDDIEDAILDELTDFRNHPLLTLAALRDPEDNPLFSRIWCDLGPAPRTSVADLEDCAAQLCTVLGVDLRQCVDFPDPDSPESGSLRLRVGNWDVADIGYDFASPDDGTVELDLISAVVPSGITAVTFEHDELDAHSVTLFVHGGASATALVDALENEIL